MIRIFLIFMTVLLFATKSVAQDFKVIVMNQSRSIMPCAYLHINGETVAATDSVGVGRLSFNVLNVNDTLEVSFVGMTTERVVLNQSILTDSSYTFVMQEKNFELDEVVIVGNAEKYFNKCAKISSSIDYNCKLSAAFSAEIAFPDGRIERASGTLVVQNEIWSKEFEHPKQFGWFHHPAEYTTDDDISSIKDILDMTVRLSLNSTNVSIREAIRGPWWNGTAHYSYLGVEGSNRVFKLACRYPNSETLNNILYIDIKTKDLTRMETQYFDEKSGMVVLTEVDFKTFTHKRPLMLTVLQPTLLKFQGVTPSGKKIKFEINNTSIKRFKSY